MKIKYFVFCILSVACFNSRAQVTHIESYYEGQGGIEGLHYPNGIVTDTSGQYLFITANHGITRLSADSTFTTYNFVERISYSSDSLRGLWNVDEIAIYNKCFYVTGHNHLYVFQWNESTDSLKLLQSITNVGNTIIGTAGTSKIAISPDNKNLYLSTWTSGKDHILIFSIDSLTGELTYHTKQDVEKVLWITVSPDNRYLYSASRGYNEPSVRVYERIIDSNSLELLQTLTANDSLSLPAKIVASHDGKSVYVYNGESEFLNVYNADEISGTLTFSQKIDINACFDNFWYTSDIFLSPDDKYLYMIGKQDISVFNRDILTGHLSFVQVIQEGENSFCGFNEIEAHLANDSILYVVSKYYDKLLMFHRNPSDGLLTHLKSVTNEDGKIRGLADVVDIKITDDGNNIYTLAYAGYNSIGIYKRLQNGRLLFNRVMVWDSLGPAIGAPYSFEVSPDDNYLFVNSANIYGIRILRRNPDNGNLVFYKSYTDPGLGLSQIRDATFSHDQQNYYTSNGTHILTYSVDPITADIIFQSFLSSDNPDSFGLAGVVSIIASNDGKNVYTASYPYSYPDGISVYSRNEIDGNLSILQTISHDQNGVSIDEPYKVLLSYDNRFLYSIGSKIHCFERDTSDGSLSHLYKIAIEDLDIPNLHKLSDAAISNDGKSLIGLTKQGKSILSFHRNQETGELTFEQHKQYSNITNYSISDPAICISSDLKNTYLVDQFSKLLSAYDLNISVGINDITQGCIDDVTLSIEDESNCIWSTGETTNSIYIDSDGEYSVYVTDSLGRQGWDTTYVMFYPELIVDLGADTTLQLSDSIVLTPDIQGSWNNSYLWNDSSTHYYNLIICSEYGVGDHMFKVEVTDSYGCIDTDTIIVSIDHINSINELPGLDFKLYPNPVNDKITIEAVLSGNNAFFTISDLNGKVIISESINGTKTTLDVSILPSGIYFGKLTNNETIVVKKFIVK